MDGYPPNSVSHGVPVTPPGLQAIYNVCRRLYPDQPNPLQVTALMKYWLGGPDPLDYISMYSNPGNEAMGIPPHWHYVSFGLSDLHGDGRVHECGTGGEGNSGFGFEVTFRLKREHGETAPPTWPASLMQSLARYVFQSENSLCVGDHIPWHSPLDGNESRIQHMLIADDPQLHSITTPLGTVNFVQIVGVCGEELKAAQHWNGVGVCDILKQSPLSGGLWLVTDMRRGESVFEMDPQVQEQVDRGIEDEGSNLSGVTGRCSWDESGSVSRRVSRDEDRGGGGGIHGDRRPSGGGEQERPHISQIESEQIKATLKKGLISNHPVLPPIRPENENTHETQQYGKSRSRKESFDSTLSSEAPTELLRTRSLSAVHVKFNLEAAALLPLCLRGRLKHGRHFTFKSVTTETAVTLVPPSVVGSLADDLHPYAAHGPWLQVLITDDFMDQMLEDVAELAADGADIAVPKTYNWPGRKLTITIVPDDV